MAFTAVKAAGASVTADSTAAGFVTVADSTPYVLGAYAYLSGPGLAIITVKIVDLLTAGKVGVRQVIDRRPSDNPFPYLPAKPNYGKTDVSAYTGPATAPTLLTTTGSNTGGTLAAATYFYKITALNAAGESVGSNEQSAVVSGVGTNSVALTWGAVTGATSYRVYRGTATGAENVFYAPGNVTAFTDTGAANTAGTPPATSTAFAAKIFQPAQAIFGDGSPEPAITY